jgi:subtilisin family serine protease
VDGSGRRSRFSTFGEHVALCAPGENIVSAGRRGYQMSSGTSFAAPFVAGAAALLLARARAAGVSLGGARVKDLLIRSATRLGPGGFCRETGHGLLNVVAALRLFDTERGTAA